MPRPRRWTDEDLRAAVPRATSVNAVCRELGLRPSGDSSVAVRNRIAELDLDISHFDRGGAGVTTPAPGEPWRVGARTWTDDDLRDAVRRSPHVTAVLQLLGLPRGATAYATVRAHIEHVNVDVSHWGVCARRRLGQTASKKGDSSKGRGKPRTWTDEELKAAVATSRSIRAVLRKLGLKVGGGTYVTITKRIADLGLDVTHFTGQGWSKGLKNPVPVRRRPLSEILVRDSDYGSTHWLRKRLIQEGRKEARCEGCGLAEWREQPMPLQLDHVNGDRTDHRIENLRVLCPNCHAQTDTWCGKNVGTRGKLGEPARSGGGTVDTQASKSCAYGREGSSPSRSTNGDQPSLF
jgi:hypothetical protein